MLYIMGIVCCVIIAIILNRTDTSDRKVKIDEFNKAYKEYMMIHIDRPTPHKFAEFLDVRRKRPIYYDGINISEFLDKKC